MNDASRPHIDYMESEEQKRITKRLKNKEAAKRCREKKRERDLNDRKTYEENTALLENKLRSVHAEFEMTRDSWLKKESTYLLMFSKLKEKFKKQKEYITLLESNMWTGGAAHDHSQQSSPSSSFDEISDKMFSNDFLF